MAFPSIVYHLFDPRGRCNRKGLFIVALSLLAVEIVTGLAFWMGEVSLSGPFGMAVKVLFFWLATVAVAKRLHDLGRSAWWIVGGFAFLIVWSVCGSLILLLSVGESVLDPMSRGFMASVMLTMFPVLVATLWLHFARGQVHSNRFGPVPQANGFSLKPRGWQEDTGVGQADRDRSAAEASFA